MIGRIIGNRYEIIEKIGGGGMSNVYKAKCNVLNRYVAIKILRDELTQDSEFVEKFKQESLSAASLTHPNIVNIYDTGIEDDIYYIVMEYVKGETLKNYIKRKTRLSEQEAVKISRQVAEALRHAHMNNIVHRDIKPHNILLTEDGTAKVTDFGIARASTSSTINNTSNVIGSVHYFSPEQARGGYVDEKSDIYSLGIVMYEMVTGTLPFDADNHISVAMKQIQEKPVPPSKRVKNLNISKNFEDIIMKCLEKHQSFRFQNIDELLKKLDALNGNIEAANEESEIIDSPTIEIPALSKKEENVIDIDLIDKNSDKAFRSFFSEDREEESNEEKDKSKNKKITIAAIFSALVIALIGGILVFKSYLYVPEVPMPDLLGRSEEEAKKIVEDLGLVFKVSKREYSNEFDEGKVMGQNVEEGVKVKENYPVEVVISMGRKEIIVPNLLGKYAIEAGTILKNAGLLEGQAREENSDTYPAGQIMDQFPKANTPANENDKVDYVVSIGPKIKYVKMPYLINSNLETAKLSIIQAGLTVGQVNEEPSEEIAEGLVMRQSVEAGQEVEEGTAIWLTVSSGKPELEEPVEPVPEEGVFPLAIALPKEKDKVTLVIQRIASDGREVVYSEEVDTSQDSILVNVKGKGTGIFEIYIDNELYDRVEITFD
ncbi:MAG TPA: Stk1 family PASTA domain-containing Ser/Thr kinase [Sedimentibacter sp.]|jgi:serine/threonine-protein kinase|nr:Stk1 family PASTA domain-containing Ser/Thr kinase [Sedimentibacter sp.]HOW22216.1 Stk1 family PASTA domain-containing Ser/Thr kinase [Sedimentibacter sp.]